MKVQLIAHTPEPECVVAAAAKPSAVDASGFEPLDDDEKLPF